MFKASHFSTKSTSYWLAMAGLVCLPGCSGCESQTSPAKPPVTTQSKPSPATHEDSSEKQSDASGRAGKDESATEIRTARGEVAAPDSDATADGESETSSAIKKSSKLATGEGAAQPSSGTGSAEREGGRSGGGTAGGKTKPSGQTGKPSSPGEAVATAQTLKLRSDKATAGKKYGQAFELATKAWESVQTFPKDAACREMSSDLQRRMDELGTLANEQRGSDLKRDKPLIVR
ncbi:MAG: hypothetical protein IAG10_18985 [Planctomycetaceae bacterium]|nr:hypothetical protein [Planctomycetaceae bacterium]